MKSSVCVTTWKRKFSLRSFLDVIQIIRPNVLLFLLLRRMACFFNKALSRESLRNILHDFEIIPEQHRLKLWTIILNLPNNKAQYMCLRETKKKLPSNIVLQEEDGLGSNTKVCNRVIQSLLAHCPSLEQFRHFNLTDYVCPFAELLASHELIYFEIMLSILSKYNFSFHSITRHLIVHIILCIQWIGANTGLIIFLCLHTHSCLCWIL